MNDVQFSPQNSFLQEMICFTSITTLFSRWKRQPVLCCFRWSIIHTSSGSYSFHSFSTLTGSEVCSLLPELWCMLQLQHRTSVLITRGGCFPKSLPSGVLLLSHVPNCSVPTRMSILLHPSSPCGYLMALPLSRICLATCVVHRIIEAPRLEGTSKDHLDQPFVRKGT